MIAILCFLLFTISAHADGSMTNVATEFVFTIFNAHVEGNTELIYAIVSNNNNGATQVTVTSSYANFSNIQITVAPQSIFKILITPNSIQDQFPDGGSRDGQIVVENKGIRLVSELPVAVYAHVELIAAQSADSFLVIPTAYLGTQYVAITNTFDGQGYANMIAAVAYTDNTQITIGTQTIVLNALQVASVSSMEIMSGKSVFGNKPFGVVSGNTCGVNTELGGACDYEAEMLYPIDAWGTQFTAVPFMYLMSNSYQVVTNTNDTVVSIGNTSVATLNAGEFRRFQTEAAIITSNHPILLVQIGQNIDGNWGDPFLLQLFNTDKMSNEDVLFEPTGFTLSPLQHFIRILADTAGTLSVQLDNTTINSTQFKQISHSTFYYYEMQISNTTHTVQTTNPSARFSVISYTYGSYEGCGFVCAFSMPKSEDVPKGNSLSPAAIVAIAVGGAGSTITIIFCCWCCRCGRRRCCGLLPAKATVGPQETETSTPSPPSSPETHTGSPNLPKVTQLDNASRVHSQLPTLIPTVSNKISDFQLDKNEPEEESIIFHL